MSAYTESVEHALGGIIAVSVGPCPGCAECGLEDEPDMDCEAYEAAGEASFGRDCDCCDSTLAGDMHPAHGLIDGNPDELIHLKACVDCVQFIANGEEPEREVS